MIITESLTKLYGNTTGIDSLDLEIANGEIFGLLGPNGAGKTTTIRLLMGLLKPTSGTARINDLDCWRDTVEIKRSGGYVPGDARLYPNYTGRQLTKLYGDVRGNSELLADLTARLDFDLTKKVRTLSKGNKQKLAIILGLMHRPDVLILDEPTSGLDPLMQREFYKILAEFKERGATCLVSSHFLPEVERICDRAAIIKDGSLVAVENVKALSTRAKDLTKQHESLEEIFLEHYE
jgi:ABC-2 type transport system ATP-binding protein